MVGGKGTGAGKPSPVAGVTDAVAAMEALIAKAGGKGHPNPASVAKPSPARPPRRQRPPAKPAIHDLVVKPQGPQPGPAAVKRIQQAQAAESLRQAHAFRARAVAEQSMVPHGVFGYAAKVIGNLSEDALYAGPGLYHAGGQIAGDVKDRPFVRLNEGKNPFPRTERVGEQMVKQTYESLRHPDRRPGDFWLNALGGAGAVAGGAARLGAGAAALREGEGLAAVTRSAAEGGGFVHAPVTRPRVFKVGDQGETTTLHPSRNHAFRALQTVHDRLVQKAITERPNSRLARYGNWRLGNSLTETSRYVEHMKRAPAHVLERKGNKLSREQQAALRLTSEQATPAERIRLAEDQAARGVNPEAQAHQIRLLSALARDGVVTVEDGRVVIDHSAPELRAVDAKLAAAGSSIDRIVEETGQMTAGALKSRRDRPNVVTASGKPVSATAIKGRKAGQTALPVDLPMKLTGTKTRFRTEAEARLRFNRIDAKYQALVEKVIPQVNPYDFGEQGRRNWRSNADKNRNPLPLVSTEIRHLAERRLYETAAAHPDLPLSKLVLERERLQQALNPDLFEPVKQAELGSVTENTYAPVETRPGRQHVTYRTTEAKGVAGSLARTGVQKVTGRARRPVTTSPAQHFEGGNLLNAQIPDKTTSLVAREWQRQIKYASTDRFRQKVARMGSATRKTERDVLVHEQQLKNTEVPEALRVILGQKHSNIGEIDAKGAQSAYHDWRGLLVRRSDASIGTAAPTGYKWVHENLLGPLKERPQMPPRAAGRAVNTLNSAQTAATVYFKPGHIATRAVTNAVTNLIQGAFHPSAMTHAAKMWHGLTDEEKAQALAMSGGGSVASLPSEGANLLARGARWGQHNWRVIDEPSRFLNLAHVAGRDGVRTTADFKQLIHDAAHPDALTPGRAAQVDRIAKDANRGSIAYDRLTDFEKQYLRKAVWFYPWIKGATVFAGRTILEHPIKSAAIANTGQYGEKHTGVGPVPWYEKGLFKVGGSKAFPLTSNTSGLSPFSTPAETYEMGKATVTGNFAHGPNLASLASPAYGAALAAALGYNPSTGAQLKGNILDRAVGELEQSNPAAILHRRLTQNTTGKLFPLTRSEALQQVFSPLGATSPKRTSQAVLAGQAASEGVKDLNTVQKAILNGKQRQDAYQAALRKYGDRFPSPVTPAKVALLKEAVHRQTLRDANYARLKIAKGAKHKGWQRQALVANVNLAVRKGWLTPAQQNVARQVIAKAPTLPMWAPSPDPSVEGLLRDLNDSVFYGAATSDFESALHKVAGHK